jgi:methylated-DNA-[protein]-cysteine S-methyltransferase
MNPVHRTFFRSPIGYIEVTGTEKGIRNLYFLDFRVRPQHVPSCLRNCIIQLEEYFRGVRREFDLEFDLEGTDFQLNVWKALRQIPYGTTITYQELARRTGNPKAQRAVGHANGQNPVSIIIPCHRVIGSNGRLVGYRAGLRRKKWLLEHEHAFSQRDLFYGKR